MGSGRSVEQQDTSPQDIINYLDDLFAYALSIGMTYEQYWYGKPTLINAYIKAEEYRASRINQELWLQGLYNHIALNTSLSNAFGKHSHAKYIDKPIPITRQEQEANERNKQQRIIKKLDSLVGKKLGGY